MFAIVEIAGQQFKLEKDKYVYTHRLKNADGEEIPVGEQATFHNVLLVDIDGDVRIGTPLLEGITITGKVLQHVKGDKVLVFKKKRRKGYKKTIGHRQYFTKVLIEEIHV